MLVVHSSNKCLLSICHIQSAVPSPGCTCLDVGIAVPKHCVWFAAVDSIDSPLPNSFVEALTSNAAVFGAKAFGR